jgi:hypothetical protein
MNDNTGRTIAIVIAIIVGCIVLTVCLAVGTIMILALLGPAIGNTFSDIVTTLESP